jgi:N6-L-threonylcarbamoyladenine synthase
VAANGPLRAAMAQRSPVPMFAPARALCTDNGAMIGACAYYRMGSGRAGLDLDVSPSLPVA